MILPRRQMAKRFGRLPGWVEEPLARLSVSETEDIGDRVFDAKNLTELLDLPAD